MTEDELKQGEELAEYLQVCIQKDWYFEISPDEARLLAGYLRELQRLAHLPYHCGS